MRVVMRGAGDIATGIALRLFAARFQVIMLETAQPTAIRRTVSFSTAVVNGTATVEGVAGVLTPSIDKVEPILASGKIAVLVDPNARLLPQLHPDALVDAILAKRNLGTARTDAPVVIGVGPGFTAGVDCHAVVETKRGHDLGRVILQGQGAVNTGIPGEIGGHSSLRVLRAPSAGTFRQVLDIGTHVTPGDVIGTVDGVPVVTEIAGILRGVLPSGIPVVPQMKCGDVDPRCALSHCYTVSDKARAVGGGVLEAILRLSPGPVTL
ncbi:MAG: selenium-dependent molybdenum cofactor biosynthesis protein YqeB [Oscillospiraceae bacterium]|nr:selenium-dependent molybdenum cofactor biosynthesis protein YqeB [Oscillospiraceae bacterium]